MQAQISSPLPVVMSPAKSMEPSVLSGNKKSSIKKKMPIKELRKVEVPRNDWKNKKKGKKAKTLDIEALRSGTPSIISESDGSK